jgi:outer membrane protein assembly factor BamA
MDQNQMAKTLIIYTKGYLFSNINAVEVRTANDTIDFEIRITEGPIAYFNKITVVVMTKPMTALFTVN